MLKETFLITTVLQFLPKCIHHPWKQPQPPSIKSLIQWTKYVRKWSCVVQSQLPSLLHGSKVSAAVGTSGKCRLVGRAWGTEYSVTVWPPSTVTNITHSTIHTQTQHGSGKGNDNERTERDCKKPVYNWNKGKLNNKKLVDSEKGVRL